jgi:hypothetical protein
LADVEVLQDMAIAENNGPNPENPPSIHNWYPRIDRLKKRLSTEIGKHFGVIESTKPSGGSAGGAPAGNASPGKAGLPAQASFPAPMTAITEPIKAKIQQMQAGDVFAGRIDKSGGAVENEEIVSLQTSDEVARQQFCDSLPAKIRAFYATQKFDCPIARPNIIVGVERCASMGMAYSASQAERDPSGMTKGCVDISPPPSREEACTKSESNGLFDRSTGACTCPSGSEFDPKTGSCGPIVYQQTGPGGGRMGDGDAKILAEAREQDRKKELEKQAAEAAASSTKTKKVLIVAGSVLALGLAGLGAWHVFAKDKPAP